MILPCGSHEGWWLRCQCHRWWFYRLLLQPAYDWGPTSGYVNLISQNAACSWQVSTFHFLKGQVRLVKPICIKGIVTCPSQNPDSLSGLKTKWDAVENRRQIGRIFDDEILDDNESDIVRARWPVCRGAIRFINYDGLLGNTQVLHHSFHRTEDEPIITNGTCML